jgi:hypothetical protein
MIAFSLLGLFLFVLAMTQFESLHHAIHADAQQRDHQCAATLLSSGQVDAPPPSLVSVIVCPLEVMAEFNCQPVVFVSFDFTLLPSCGPPALLS